MWEAIERHRATFEASGEFRRRRERQRIQWMRALLEERVLRRVFDNEAVKARLAHIEREVASGGLAPESAVEQILDAAR
jgi:LAO/AO transport system kinase